MRGINVKENNVETVIKLCGQVTHNFKNIITVGISSGGFMASIVASRLGANSCFNFSGQNNLWNSLERNPRLLQFKDTATCSKYFNIGELIKNTQCDIYYFYAGNCLEDLNEYEEIAEIPNVHGYVFSNDQHASTMCIWNMPYIILISKERLLQIEKHYRGKKTNMIAFHSMRCQREKHFVDYSRRYLGQ